MTKMQQRAEEQEERVRIFLPVLEEDASASGKVDQTEHVTINGVTTLIRRGEYVDVPQNVFFVLKQKYKQL